MSLGWPIPPPRPRVTKTPEIFRKEREAMVARLEREGFLKSPRLKRAMLKVPRELFVPKQYADYAYEELPFPLPGNGRNQTISCPHSYPLFYEALKLNEGDRFLEVGTGSGYGAALAREVVGSKGLVVTVEINPATYKFAKSNLDKLGYKDVIVILGDGSLGYSPLAPYNKICVTAACPKIPPPLIEQLSPNGRLVAPVGYPNSVQDLILLEKLSSGKLRTSKIDEVLYVPLKGKYGWA